MKWFKIICLSSLMCLFLFLTGCGGSDSANIATWNSTNIATWESASLVTDSARYPHIGVDGSGNVFSVWVQVSGFYANRYNSISGWGTPQKISDLPVGWSNFHFAVGKSGQAIAAWLNEEPGNNHVEAVRYVAGTGWGAVENLGDIGTPKDIAIADNGSAFIVTENLNGTTKGLTIERFSQAIGWYNIQIAYTDASTSNGFPKISINNLGYGFVLWVEGNSGTNKVYVSQCSDTVQGQAEQIASIVGMPGWTDIVTDSNGNAMALWGQQDSTLIYHTYARRYAVFNGWGEVRQIDNSNFDCIDQAVTIGSSGNFYAVWTQRTDTSQTNIYCSQYNLASGWQAPRLIGTGGTARYPQVAADANGNAFVAWQQYDPNDPFSGDANIYSNYYSAGTGWGTQQLLKRTLGSADSPELVVDPFGKATVMWSQSTASVGGSITYGIFFSRFD